MSRTSSPHGALHGVALRSPHAHARIVSIDAAAARAMPGVALVLTGADLAAEGIGPLPCPAVVATIGPLIVPARPALARDAVKHVGEPVALVVAATPAAGARRGRGDPGRVRDPARRGRTAARRWPPARRSSGPRRRATAPSASSAATAPRRRPASPPPPASSSSTSSTTASMPRRSSRAAPSANWDGTRFDLLFSGMGVHGIRKQLATVFGLRRRPPSTCIAPMSAAASG